MTQYDDGARARLCAFLVGEASAEHDRYLQGSEIAARHELGLNDSILPAGDAEVLWMVNGGRRERGRLSVSAELIV